MVQPNRGIRAVPDTGIVNTIDDIKMYSTVRDAHIDLHQVCWQVADDSAGHLCHLYGAVRFR